jgi:Short C-terminal domain
VGLLKTAATVAVASSVHGRIQRRQQARWAAQDQALAGTPPSPPPYAAPVPPQQAYTEPAPPTAAATPPPAPAASQPSGTGDRLAQLKQLGELLSAGVLSQAEFEQEKARILNG